MKGDYICRRGEKATHPSDHQHETGRIICPYCGGTCDPSPKKQRELLRVRAGFNNRVKLRQ